MEREEAYTLLPAAVSSLDLKPSYDVRGNHMTLGDLKLSFSWKN